MSRTAKIARALTIGYGYQAAVAVTGLVLTPFLLSRLGAGVYGQWLVVGQVLAALVLLDLGVAAVLPREVARASAGSDPDGVAGATRRAVWLVAFQTPVVALVALGVWLGVSAVRPELARPLAVILGAFVVQFPLRLPAAVLTGLQDQSFCAAANAAGWVVATATSVGLVFGGWGLLALAVGWAVGQGITCGAAALRLRFRFPHALGFGWPGRSALGGQLRASLWTSAAQLSQVLIAGTDLFILAWLLGPPAAVAYSCTIKLITILSNQCYAIGLTAQPALAHMRATGDTDGTVRAVRVTGLAQLLLSGAVAVGVVAVNSAFVPLWVGAEQFAGPAVTLLAATAMLVRHLAFAWWSAAYVLGAERRLSVVLLADGVVTAAAVVGWVTAFGVPGAPLGSLTGAVLIYAPLGLVTLAGRLGVTPGRALGWVGPWAVRVGIVLVPVAAATFHPAARGLWGGSALAALGVGGYALGAYSLAGREPLRGYRDRALAAVGRVWRRRVGTGTGPVATGTLGEEHVRAERATDS